MALAYRPAATTEAHVKANMTVLVVEDELLIRWSLRNCLQRLGLKVLEAESGEAGLITLPGLQR